MDLVRKRMLMSNRKGSDEDMEYELTKPKLIVDYTITEKKVKYEFMTTEYPELAKCKWICMYVNFLSKPTGQPWVVVSINNSKVCGIDTGYTYNVVKIQKLNGLWSACGTNSDNASYICSDKGTQFFWPTDISTAVAYSPIESISLNSYTNCLAENTTIKIYGFY